MSEVGGEGQSELARLCQAGEQFGCRVYVVGGAVRDHLLGLPTKDLDCVVASSDPHVARQLASLWVSSFGGTLVELDKKRGTFRVISPALGQVDLACLVGPNLASDLQQRDFTVNAIAYDPLENVLIDYCGGREDLAKGMLRPVSDSVFDADPLRMLRAVRMLCTYRFTAQASLWPAIAAHAPQLKLVAGERIRDEFFGCLRRCLGPWFAPMLASGLARQVLPEIASENLVAVRLQVVENWFERLAVCQSDCAGLDSAPSSRLVEYLNQGYSYGRTKAQLLKLLCLLPDSGPDGNMAVGQRLKLAGSECKALALVLSRRERLVQALESGCSRLVWHRYLRNLHDNLPLAVMAALLAALAGAVGDARTLNRRAGFLLADYFALGSVTSSTSILNGKEIMQLLGCSAGPVVKHVQQRIAECRAVKRHLSANQARRLVAAWGPSLGDQFR